MSVTWQLYIDYMKAKGKIEDCMIVDSEDGSTWASTKDFFVSYVGFCLIKISRSD